VAPRWPHLSIAPARQQDNLFASAKRHHGEDYDRLHAIRDAGDREGWLAFFLRGVSEVSREATQAAAVILRKPLCGRLAQAARGGGDQRNAVLESAHVRLRHQ
jgi:hypothetical protein